MLSLRSSGKITGSSVSIRQLAKQHKLSSSPISMRELLRVLGVRDNLIKHVFVLMLENRSFDHMLGFSVIAGTNAATGQPTTIDGLNGTESNSFEGRTFTVSADAPDVIGVDPEHDDPDHDFDGTLEQLCGPGARYKPGGAYPPIVNTGFASSYGKKAGPSLADRVMKCYSPDQVPVLNALAREFVVCDHWFGSMPGPTFPNRFFMHANTSDFFDDNPSPSSLKESATIPGAAFDFDDGNIFEHLDDAGVNWRIYTDENFPVASLLSGVGAVSDIEPFHVLAEDLTDPDFDLGFILIEPDYDFRHDFQGGNSQHPSGSVTAGERFMKDVYETIRNSPVWERSMLIITYDEHGGFFDHVPPPPAQGTGKRGREHGFTFEQLGPRVPAVIVSPLIRRNLIEHRTLDHTDINATLSQVFNFPNFGPRKGHGGVTRLADLPAARTDAPLRLPEPAFPSPGKAVDLIAPRAAPARPDLLIADDPDGAWVGLVAIALRQHLQVAPPEQHAAIRARVQELQHKTRAEAFEYLKEVEQLVQAKRVQVRSRPV